jgi:hypothetical protein
VPQAAAASPPFAEERQQVTGDQLGGEDVGEVLLAL